MKYSILQGENHPLKVEITKLSDGDYVHFYDQIHLFPITHLSPCLRVILHWIGRDGFHLQILWFSLI